MLYLIRNNEQLNIKLIDIFLKDTVKIEYEAYFNQEFINTYNFNLNKTCDVHNNVIDSVISFYSSVLKYYLKKYHTYTLEEYFLLYLQ